MRDNPIPHFNEGALRKPLQPAVLAAWIVTVATGVRAGRQSDGIGPSFQPTAAKRSD
jgi:hypothetical protein